MCPHCGQNAPVVYRGVVAYCTACGKPRPPLTGKALHFAGQGSRVGGALARAFGWIVLFGGATLAIGVGFLAQLAFGGLAWAIAGLPLAAIAVAISIGLLRGASSLDRKGDSAARHAQAQAVYALASHKQSALTAADVARALEIPPAQADALLSELAREHYDQISVDVDGEGNVLYRFGVPGVRVRVDPEVARSPNREEWERLEAQEQEQRRAAQRRAR